MKILYVTTISLTMNTFFKPHVEMLVNEGYQVDIACNYKDLPLDEFYASLGCNEYQIDFSRSPLSTDNMKAYRQLKRVVENGGYDIVHCHTPVAGLLGRLASIPARKKGTRVIYTAHGFHFYKGAPLKNWLVYYPIEWVGSLFTDTLITINHEDYELAKRKMKAKRVEYVPGVGIDVDKFKNTVIDRAEKRRELGIPEDAFLLVSVGELNANKNHEVIIRAVSMLNDDKVHYAIAGVGELREYLLNLAIELGIADKVHLLGYRNDIAEIYKAADVCCFPSIREGLGLAAIEGMAAGLPIVAADNRGTREFVVEKINGFACKNNQSQEFVDALQILLDQQSFKKQMGGTAAIKAEMFNICATIDHMRDIYGIVAHL